VRKTVGVVRNVCSGPKAVYLYVSLEMLGCSGGAVEKKKLAGASSTYFRLRGGAAN
jgi:hypothetical protein